MHTAHFSLLTAHCSLSLVTYTAKFRRYDARDAPRGAPDAARTRGYREDTARARGKGECGTPHGQK